MGNAVKGLKRPYQSSKAQIIINLTLPHLDSDKIAAIYPSCHSFHPSLAAHLLKNGYDIHTIQELLGHKSVETTLIHTHVMNKGGMGVKSPAKAIYLRMRAMNELLNRQDVDYPAAGSKKMDKKYGESLLCVRYQYDSKNGRKFKTVELIVENEPWHKDSKRITADKIAAVIIGYDKIDKVRIVRPAGGAWNRRKQWRQLCCLDAVALGLHDRIQIYEMSKLRKKRRQPSEHSRPSGLLASR